MKRPPSHKYLAAYPKKCEALNAYVDTIETIYFDKSQINRTLWRPHFSFCASFNVDLNVFQRHIEDCGIEFDSFSFTLRCAMLIHNPILGYNIALVADEGLHNFLKISVLLNSDIVTKGRPILNGLPKVFVPKVNLGWVRTFEEGYSIQQEINQERFEYSGYVDTLTIREVTKDGWQDVYEFSLN